MQFLYLDRIHELLSCIEQEETGAMEACVELLAKCVMDHHSIYTFGASHAGILSEELYYRAGGLMLFNPIFARELMLDNEPITLTSKMERCVGYGTQIANSKVSFQEGDVLIIHSVSGRNPVSIEIAMEAKKHHARQSRGYRRRLRFHQRTGTKGIAYLYRSRRRDAECDRCGIGTASGGSGHEDTADLLQRQFRRRRCEKRRTVPGLSFQHSLFFLIKYSVMLRTWRFSYFQVIWY